MEFKEDDRFSIPENMHAERVKLSQIIDLDRLMVPGINFYKITVDDFYTSLTDLYRKGEINTLDGSMAVCIGGTYRSPRVNNEFFDLGIIMPKKFPKDQIQKGMDILTLEELIDKGKVTDEGYLLPSGFVTPVKTLFLTLNLRGSEMENACLFAIRVSNKYQSVNKQANLNIVVMQSEENELIRRGKKFEDEVLS